MKILLLFVAAQMAGNGIACLIAALASHLLRPRLVTTDLPRCLCYASPSCSCEVTTC